jgi:PEP-CTERM motif
MMPALAVIALFAVVPVARADVLTQFASYFETYGGQDFVWHNPGHNGIATFDSVRDSEDVTGKGAANSVAIKFNFLHIAGLPAALSGVQDAHLTFHAQSSHAAAMDASGNDNQALGTITIDITRDTPFMGHTDLLHVVITGGSRLATLTGPDGGGGAVTTATQVPASPKMFVKFSSDFVSFAKTIRRSASLGWNSINNEQDPGGGFEIGDKYIDSFDSSGIGNFSSTPPPTFFVPEPASMTLAAFGIIGLLGRAAYKRRKAAQ